MNLDGADEKIFKEKLTKIILTNLGDENFGIKEVEKALGMSRSSINRKLQSYSLKPVGQFIKETRLQKAKEFLVNEELTVSEAAYKAGFGSPAYFSTCFSEYFGYPPGEAKKWNLPETENVNQLTVNENVVAVKEQYNKPGIHKKKKILFYSLTGILILFIAVANIFFFSHLKTSYVKKSTEKTIAVLPFLNDSPDSSNVYFINGMMEAILNNLSKINDLQVLSRTSVEKFRNNRSKTVREIAGELGVNYIVEGSGQKMGNQIVLFIQLIEAKTDKHILSERYSRNLENIFDLQEEVATAIASKIEAVITSEEAEIISKHSTTNMPALNQYFRGRELRQVSQNEYREDLKEQSGKFFREAIRLDSTFSNAYVQLGYVIRHGNNDSAMFLADKALTFDNKNAEAYGLKAFCYSMVNDYEKAEEQCKLALRYEPNNPLFNRYMAQSFFYRNQFYNSLDYGIKTLKFDKSLYEQAMVNDLFSDCLVRAGFYDEAMQFAMKRVELENDSMAYYIYSVFGNINRGNFSKAFEIANNALSQRYNFDSYLFTIQLYSGNYEEAYRYLNKMSETSQKRGNEVYPGAEYAFIYNRIGEKNLADKMYERSLKKIEEIMKIPVHNIYWSWFSLMEYYASLNQKEKALEYLRKLINAENKYFASNTIQDLKSNPIYDCIRPEPEFVRFLQMAETSFLTEHAKIENLLRKEKIIP